MSGEKRRTNRAQRVLVILLMCVTLAMAGLACALALKLYRREDPTLIGTWRMQLDLRETARARGNAWLQNAKLGERVDLGDTLPALTVPVELELRQDGSWSRTVNTEAFEKTESAAEKALADALRELLRLRIEEMGRPAVTPAEAEEQIQNALGLTAEEYLAARGPALLPGEAELRARFDGSGSYLVEGAVIRFDGARTAQYLTDDTLLVLSFDDGTEVYTRAKR